MLLGFVSWPVTFSEGHKLRVLKDVFGAKGVETTGDWRKLQNEMLRTCTIHKILFS
jgi:hypothetical protein